MTNYGKCTMKNCDKGAVIEVFWPYWERTAASIERYLATQGYVPYCEPCGLEKARSWGQKKSVRPIDPSHRDNESEFWDE